MKGPLVLDTRYDLQPSRVRYAVLGVTFAMAFLLYLHRFCMSYAQRYIREDLQLSNDDLSLCFSAFFLSYALAQVPSGWMSDRYGARVMLSLYILVWSFFTAMMGWTMGLASLLVVRLATGLAQAGAYPTAAGLIARWVPDSSRGAASAFVAWGGRLGSGLAPILTTMLIAVFVPLSTPPQLTERAILDEPMLRRQLMESSQLSTDDDVVDGRPETQRGLRAVIAEQVPPDAPSLVDGLNTLIESGSSLVSGDLPGVAMEREARNLLRRSTSLEPAEVRRLNRLLIESAFPETIGKLYVRGWREVMWTYGAGGLLVAALFWLVFRNRPDEHPACNTAEIALIQQGRPQSANRPVEKLEKPPLRAIMTSRSLWLMCISQWGSNVGWVFLVTWLPRFLLEEHAVPLLERGWMCAIPLWVGWCGMLLGGRATDSAVQRFGLRRGRIMPLAAGKFMAMGAYLLCLLHPSPWTLTAVFGLVAFSSDLGSASSWAYKQDVGGRHIGSVLGWANMWGNLGATASPILLNEIIGTYGWDAAFLTCAAAYLLSGLAALGVDASIPIIPDAASSSEGNSPPENAR